MPGPSDGLPPTPAERSALCAAAREATPTSFIPRTALDSDANGVVALISGCYAEFPGAVFDPVRIDVDLLAPATYFGKRGGEFLVVEREGAIVGCVGWGPGWLEADSHELKRLYVRADCRRYGLGRSLVSAVEHSAITAGRTAMELWTDSRFRDAHRMYERLGYRPGPIHRALGDPSHTMEQYWLKPLRPSAVAG